MGYRGHVKNGAIVADEPVELPDGTRVEILVLETGRRKHHPDVERFAGIIPPDAGDEGSYWDHVRNKYA